MPVHTKLADHIQEVDVIIAGGKDCPACTSHNTFTNRVTDLVQVALRLV